MMTERKMELLLSCPGAPPLLSHASFGSLCGLCLATNAPATLEPCCLRPARRHLCISNYYSAYTMDAESLT
jgi:hypothetical protein